MKQIHKNPDDETTVPYTLKNLLGSKMVQQQKALHGWWA